MLGRGHFWICSSVYKACTICRIDAGSGAIDSGLVGSEIKGGTSGGNIHRLDAGPLVVDGGQSASVRISECTSLILD